MLGALGRGGAEREAEGSREHHRRGVVTTGSGPGQAGKDVLGADVGEKVVQQHRPGISARYFAGFDAGDLAWTVGCVVLGWCLLERAGRICGLVPGILARILVTRVLLERQCLL